MKIHDIHNSGVLRSSAFGENDAVDAFWCPPNEDEFEEIDCKYLADKLENSLRQAKLKLHCDEVIFPTNLNHRIARDIMHMSVQEPCGWRGCVIYINLEEKKLRRHIGKVKCDPDAVATFEVFLNLKTEWSSWFSMKQKIKVRMGFKSAVVISEGYTLNKNKLYRSSSLH
ncbi:DNA damage-inducible transcript 4-like protein [Limulus polyphemus]|uniref:DNA damage-inducible transcript 4-like protein n=1 Tax=Limulus polyphemus TaxID=6850 RepID=A0ABM1TFF7_LIMPO|nr:DNA damage-inducible transcript 4-like protein [Limulus polyphemus]